MWFNSKQREEPYLDLTSPALPLIGEVPSGTGRQVVHGCRQLVSWDVGLSPATSATLIVSCYHLVEHSSETARVNREEGGDDVKSSCPLCLGLHTCYNGKYKEKQDREVEQNSKTCLSSDCRLKLAYMKLELLVIANSMSRWIRSRALYTPPVTPWELAIPNVRDLTRKGGSVLR